MSRELPLLVEPFGPARAVGVRVVAALALRRLVAALDRLEKAMAPAAVRACPREPVLEFYAEAGAPEGALFVDGELAGTLEGVGRL